MELNVNTLDLDISHYNLDDLLRLFKLDIHFNEDELNRAKRCVYMTHPDKSQLPQKYFLFFKEAYKNLLAVYNFRNRSNSNRDHLDDMLKTNKETLEKAAKQVDFNKKFNMLFEKHISSVQETNGYGEWLKSTADEPYATCKNQREMNEIIDHKKRELRAIVCHEEIKGLGGQGIEDLDGTCPDGYQSALFSKLAYDDLKHAHEESVIPVTQSDMTHRPHTIIELQTERGQSVQPINEHEAQSMLANEESENSKSSAYRAYRLAQQDEIARKATENWLGGFQQLTDS